MELYLEGKPATYGELFEAFYQPLNRLIDYNNLSHLSLGWGQARTPDSREQANLKNEWFSQVKHIDAIARFEGEELRVKPRTNFAPSAPKRPNILHLKDEHGTRYILREARTYDTDYLQRRFAERVESYPALSEFSFDFSSYNTYQRPPEDVLYPVSEPALIRHLHSFDTRIAPPLTILEDNGIMYFLRDFYPVLEDSSLDLQVVAEHLARYHSLGLVDLIDRDVRHYCLDDSLMYNYDLDFQVITSSQRAINTDLGDFRHKILISDELFLTEEMADEIMDLHDEELDRISFQQKTL
ncbi:MAG: hypothetical protein ACQESG_07305 [Nanobdellota archaeon]